MVRVMDYKESQRNHVSYIDYVNKTKTKEYVKLLHGNRYFVYMQRADENSNIVTCDKRTFGKLYTNSLPLISPDNNILCMPRFSNAMNQKNQN